MTDQEINIEIAEYCGWKNIREQDYQPIGTDPYIDGPSQVWVGIHPESDSNSDEYEALPDYRKDFNAMHEAKETLNFHQQTDYVRNLMIQHKDFPMTNAFFATARQCAEAFLKTIGKWKE